MSFEFTPGFPISLLEKLIEAGLAKVIKGTVAPGETIVIEKTDIDDGTVTIDELLLK